MIQASFTDLVGTSAVPAHAFDIAELTELTPTLATATVTHDMAEQAAEGASDAVTAIGVCLPCVTATWPHAGC